VRTTTGNLAAKQLVAVSGGRIEPITYWIRLGDRVIASGLQQKLRRLSYTLVGKVPDGMLVRVSSIDPNAGHAYRVQQQFIDSLLVSLPADDRVRLTGSFVATPP